MSQQPLCWWNYCSCWSRLYPVRKCCLWTWWSGENILNIACRLMLIKICCCHTHSSTLLSFMLDFLKQMSVKMWSAYTVLTVKWSVFWIVLKVCSCSDFCGYLMRFWYILCIFTFSEALKINDFHRALMHRVTTTNEPSFHFSLFSPAMCT